MEALSINSIFNSASGEPGPVIPQGAVTTFIRLQGCNLRCPYCDTKETQEKAQGIEMTVQRVFDSIYHAHPSEYVLITGGEPLLQRQGLLSLVPELHKIGKKVQIETNGTQPLLGIEGVGYSMDIKEPATPNSPSKSFAPDILLNELRYGWGTAAHGLLDLKFVVQDPTAALALIRPYMTWQLADCINQYVISPVLPMADKDSFASLFTEVVTLAKVEGVPIHKIVAGLQIHKFLNLA